MTKRLRRQRRIARRRFLRGVALGTLGFCTACAIDTYGIEPEWLEVVESNLPVGNLPEAFAGMRLIHVSDLHLSTTVSEKYLRKCIERINHLNADVVVLTGDYVTIDGRGRFKDKIIQLIGDLKSREGVYACLGNHDYGVLRSNMTAQQDMAKWLTKGLQQQGVTVLRNQSRVIERDGQKLWIVGMGDLWSGDCKPDKAFRPIGTDGARIVLSHNPDSIETLIEYQPEVVLCGHTHGGQVRIPFVGPPIVPIRNRQYHAGMFELGPTRMYVNRGLGRLGRIRFNCRPEITVFTLQNIA